MFYSNCIKIEIDTPQWDKYQYNRYSLANQNNCLAFLSIQHNPKFRYIGV